MSDIDMQFTTDEASALLRALAIARQRPNGIDERDDLELLHGRIYDAVYRTQRHDSGAAVRESHRKRVVEIRPIPHLSPEHVITAA